MAGDQYYHKVGDEADGLISEKGAELRAPPESNAPWWKKSLIVTMAVIIAILTVMLAALGTMIVKQTDVTGVAATATAAADSVIPDENPFNNDSETEDVATADHIPQTSLEILDCGSNPTEAREKGCIFDVMMQLWTPAPCFDGVLSERFLAMGNWTWWSSPDAEHSLTLDEMKKGEHTVIYVIQDYHKSHCIYAWEKLVRAMRNEEPLIEELISYDHVIHCRHKTLQRTDGDSVTGVRAPTGYTKCGHYTAWKGHLPYNEHSSVDK